MKQLNLTKPTALTLMLALMVFSVFGNGIVAQEEDVSPEEVRMSEESVNESDIESEDESVEEVDDSGESDQESDGLMENGTDFEDESEEDTDSRNESEENEADFEEDESDLEEDSEVEDEQSDLEDDRESEDEEIEGEVELYIKEWYPKQKGPSFEYVFVCDADFDAESYSWFYDDGHKLIEISNGDTFHGYESPGTYDVSCVAHAERFSETGKLTIDTNEVSSENGFIEGEDEKEVEETEEKDTEKNEPKTEVSQDMNETSENETEENNTEENVTDETENEDVAEETNLSSSFGLWAFSFINTLGKYL